MRDTSLLEEFLLIPEFSGMSEEDLAWLASEAQELLFQRGELMLREGDPADILTILVEGEVRFRRDAAGAGSPVYISRAPEIGGALPLSRMVTFSVTAVALTECRVAVFPVSFFPEMLRHIPDLNRVLASVMADRIRWSAEVETQYEKQLALGKLAGGLAHELNNPAAAARRAVEGVRNALRAVRESTVRLGQLGYPDFAWKLLDDYEEAAMHNDAELTAGLERTDREERVSDWLRGHGVGNPWDIAAALADWDADVDKLDDLAAKCPARFLQEVLVHTCSVLTAERLVRETHNSLVRISDLVSAFKSYSYMDQQQVQEVDLHEGLESTLTILGYRMENVRVVRTFDRGLKRICADGGALNQVWTHLIENALDAMCDRGELRVRTALELDCALVEIGDSGPGVPGEIQGRIFEPFFTTKPMGKGNGLGLDLVRKLLWNHNGSIMLESQPGNTRFQVRLPFSQMGLAASV